MISSYFISRPIFACVLSIIIILAGFAALRTLPLEQYPNLAPPQIQVSGVFPGADAMTVAENVAAPIEQQINGVENMIYMVSQNSASGEMNLNIFFDIGTDIDMAQVNVQNRVNMALPQLPPVTQQLGVAVRKQTSIIMMMVAIQSPSGRYDDMFLSNYVSINVVDELLRLPGVSNAMIFDARDYAMRIWLRPDRMAQFAFTVEDVVAAIQEQNSNFGTGQIGRAPTTTPVELTLPVTVKGRLSEPEEFGNIVLRANEDGSIVQIKDIARVELGAASYDMIGDLNGKSATIIAVYQQFGANALDVAERVKKKLAELAKTFPAGIEYSIPYDTTRYIQSSIAEVIKTIFESAFLVALVVLLFLQKWRAALIPLLAMLVSIIGTFAGMYLLGFSINTLTLFGLILAIGIVVDDAIIVIENIERNMRELHLPAKDAAYRAMEEISSAVIATTCVLVAVFIPVAFVGGISGKLYQQFAITIAISVIISAIVALTLAPALAVFFFQKELPPNRFALWFNRMFDRFTQLYLSVAALILRKNFIGITLFASVLGMLLWLMHSIPTGFVPDEDQGYLIAVANLPDGASLARTDAVDKAITSIAMQQPGVQNVLSYSGYNLLDNVNLSSQGANFIILTDWNQRKTAPLQTNEILKSLYLKYQAIPEAQVFTFNAPPIAGLGIVGGFEFWIENRGHGQIEKLESVVREFVAKASQRKELAQISTPLQIDNMQLFANLDRYKARSLGVSIADVFQSLQVFLGSLYVNDFNKFGRTFRVTLQADPKYRSKISDINEVYVRASTGEMIPISSLLSIDNSTGPNLVSRFNGFFAAKVMGNAAPGYSSGQAMQAIEEVAKEVLPEGMTFAWAGQAYQEKSIGSSSMGILLVGMVVVYLILCALYERWLLPLAILLAVPLGLLGAFLAIWLRGTPNDVYFQVGLVSLVGLAAKNAILIVEFAMQKHIKGMSIMDASLEASKLRFRAILMTSLTFILGVLPLVISQGAGSASRQSVGNGVFGGMLTATILAVLLVPLFFKWIAELSAHKAEVKS